MQGAQCPCTHESCHIVGRGCGPTTPRAPASWYAPVTRTAALGGAGSSVGAAGAAAGAAVAGGWWCGGGGVEDRRTQGARQRARCVKSDEHQRALDQCTTRDPPSGSTPRPHTSPPRCSLAPHTHLLRCRRAGPPHGVVDVAQVVLVLLRCDAIQHLKQLGHVRGAGGRELGTVARGQGLRAWQWWRR
jgi:hypothetical protein